MTRNFLNSIINPQRKLYQVACAKKCGGIMYKGEEACPACYEAMMREEMNFSAKDFQIRTDVVDLKAIERLEEAKKEREEREALIKIKEAERQRKRAGKPPQWTKTGLSVNILAIGTEINGMKLKKQFKALGQKRKAVLDCKRCGKEFTTDYYSFSIGAKKGCKTCTMLINREERQNKLK